MRILLVEDEQDLALLLKKGLKKQKYAVDIAKDGEEAIFLYSVNSYDVIYLDLNLPKVDGLDILKRIRDVDLETRIIIVSARSKIEDRVLGLDLGANDYLVKPFDFSELAARIRSQIRLKHPNTTNIIKVRDLTLDTNLRELRIKDKLIDLTNKEYSILEYLLFNKNKLMSKEKIISHVWDNDTEMYDSALKFHLHSLRKKLAGDYIDNLRGQGYMVKDNEDN